MKRSLPVLLRSLSILSLLSCSLFVCGFASAQTPAQATFAGVLSDPSGKPIADAHIAMALTGSAASTAPTTAETQSRDDGSFTLTLPPGTYRLVITRAPFTRVERDINLSGGQQLELKLQLAIEPMAANVLVTAQATPEPTTSTPAPVTIITKQEIDERGVDTLADLLVTESGFSLGRTGPEGGLTSLFLNGGNSNYTKVLVDGAPMATSGGVVDFSNYTLDNVDKIEVVQGAESALYGSNAMTGAIQIFTHRGETQTPELVLEGDGGSFNTGQGSAVLSGILGRFDYSTGYAYFSTAGQGPNTFFFNRTMSGNFGYKFSDKNTVRVVIRQTTSDAGTPGPLLLEPLLDEPPDIYADNSQRDLAASLQWDLQTGAHWRWHLTANETDLRDVDTDKSPFPDGFVSTDVFNRAGFTAQGSYVLQNAEFTGGYAYEVEDAFPGALEGEHARRNNMAGFLDARWQVTKRLTVNAGGRAEDNTTFGTRVVPRVGGAYLLHSGSGVLGDTRLRAFYGQGIDEPEMGESFGNDPCFPGNPNLSPEESRTASGGIDQGFAFAHLHVSADYFYNDFHNLISFALVYPPPTALADTCPFGTGTYFNTDRANARGMNWSSSMQPIGWLRLSGHYSYDDSRVLVSANPTDPTEFPGNHLLRRPVNTGSVVADITVRRFNANLLGYFSGKATDSDFFGLGFNHDPGYSRFDVSASYRLQRHVSLIFRTTNLLNKLYETALGYPELGREIRGGIKITLGGE